MALRNDILLLMESERGRVFSGTMLAERFGVSRNAVHKAINALKSEGHMIESLGRRGYVLSKESDKLSADSIRAFLGSGYSDIKIFAYDEVDSTNDEARRFMLTDKVSRAVFAANSQTAGRGHFGTNFRSPADSGLYLSAIQHIRTDIARAAEIADEAARAAALTVGREAGREVLLSETNELMLDGGKTGGILSEAVTDLETGEVQSVVIGIGLYISEEGLPDGCTALGSHIPRSRLAAGLIKAVYGAY